MHEGGAWSVMQQRRWVSYIYRYREFVRCEIAGFIKVQRISNKDTDVTRIRMGMKMYKELQSLSIGITAKVICLSVI